jgi:hypothetical protein
MTMGRAIHRADDGSETDITEGVQALYDLVISSMDWGSGFWTEDDAAPVSLIGHLLGFAKIDQVDKYIADRVHERELFAYRETWVPPVVSRPLKWAEDYPEHDHVFSSVGRCMWPGCVQRDG